MVCILIYDCVVRMFSCSLKCARATERVEPCTNCARMARRRFDAMEEDDSFELNSSVAGVSKEPDDSFDVESYAEESISSRSTTSTHSGFGRRPVVVKSE